MTKSIVHNLTRETSTMTHHPRQPGGNVSKTRVPMRAFSSASYGADGRAASALEPEGRSNLGYTNARGVTDQLEALDSPGVHGAPSHRQKTAREVQGPQPGPKR